MKRTYLLLLQITITCACFSQNVGIGTTTPGTRLHVSGMQSNISIFNGGNGMFITLAENGNNRGYIGSYAGNDEDVDFGAYNGTTGKVHLTTSNIPRLTVSSNGNVGINILSPNAKLEIRGALGFSSTTKRWEMNYDSSNGYFYIDEFGAGRRLYIKNGGNVGINTPNPQSTLDINGDLNVENKILLNNTAGNSGQVLVSGGNSASPTWRNASFSSPDRFMYSVQTGLTISGQSFTDTIFYDPVYTPTTAVTYNSGKFIINKTGFYGIEANFSSFAEMSASNPNSSVLLIYMKIKYPFNSIENTFLAHYGVLDFAEIFVGKKLLLGSLTLNKSLHLPAGTQFYFDGMVTSDATGLCGFVPGSALSIYLISE